MRAAEVALTDEQRATLRGWLGAGKTERRMAFRAGVILAIAEGLSNKAVAERVGTRPATVSKWRGRVAQEGVSGLRDAPRSGKPRQYQGEHERRVLAALDEPPPAGYGRWDGSLLARHLGDISKHQIWRVLRRHEISLARRRSWCISTDPAFAQKAADIVGLYLQPPVNAMVFSVDEKPHIQALERAQGWLKLPNGKALTGFSHEYKRHGTVTLMAGIDLLTGVIPVDNILFASEMIGAVRGIDPETGHNFDDTRRYIEAAHVDPAQRQLIYEGNARRVYPRLDAALKAKGR